MGIITMTWREREGWSSLIAYEGDNLNLLSSLVAFEGKNWNLHKKSKASRVRVGYLLCHPSFLHYIVTFPWKQTNSSYSNSTKPKSFFFHNFPAFGHFLQNNIKSIEIVKPIKMSFQQYGQMKVYCNSVSTLLKNKPVLNIKWKVIHNCGCFNLNMWFYRTDMY